MTPERIQALRERLTADVSRMKAAGMPLGTNHFSIMRSGELNPSSRCGCLLSAVHLGQPISNDEAFFWYRQSAANILGITKDQAIEIECGFEGYRDVPGEGSPLYLLGAEFRSQIDPVTP